VEPSRPLAALTCGCRCPLAAVVAPWSPRKFADADSLRPVVRAAFGSERRLKRGLHFHDLRHTGNMFAAAGGAGIKDLMARMGHDSERAAMICQHQARGADEAITNAIDAQLPRARLSEKPVSFGP
jgi:integrase